MILGMDDLEATRFIERISATAIVNQAVLRCMITGLPLNADNVILCVGDFIDPSNEQFGDIIEQILLAIDVTIGVFDQPPATRAENNI